MSRLNEETQNTYLEALLAGDRQACTAIVQDLLAKDIGLQVLYLDLLQNALYKVGILWQTNRISVATEHMATAITEGLLNLFYPILFDAERNGRNCVVACCAREMHQVGAKMVADLMELRGWNCYFIGANTPTKELLTLLDEKRPDLLGFSISLFFNLDPLLESVQSARDRASDLPIIVGGQGILFGGQEKVKAITDVEIVTSIDSLDDYLGSHF